MDITIMSVGENEEKPKGTSWNPIEVRRINFIEDRQVIQAILKHPGLWLVQSRLTPKAHALPALNQNGSGPAGYVLDHFSQILMYDAYLYRDSDDPWDAYLQSW